MDRLIITSFVWLLHYSPKVVPLKLFSTYSTWNLPLNYLESKCPLINTFLNVKKYSTPQNVIPIALCVNGDYHWRSSKKQADKGNLNSSKIVIHILTLNICFTCIIQWRFSNSVRQILTKIKDEKLRLSITN